MLIIEKQCFSQNGEDGVITSVFATIGTRNRYFAEIGCADGEECNTRQLEQLGWEGFKIDRDHLYQRRRIYKHTVTPDNVCYLLDKHDSPVEPDLFSLDIDSVDWHVLHAVLHEFRPRMIIAEYNAMLGPDQAVTVPMSQTMWEHDDYFGASYRAFVELGAQFGYQCVHCEASGTNMFMVHQRALPANAPQGVFVQQRHVHTRDPKNRPFCPISDYLNR